MGNQCNPGSLRANFGHKGQGLSNCYRSRSFVTGPFVCDHHLCNERTRQRRTGLHQTMPRRRYRRRTGRPGEEVRAGPNIESWLQQGPPIHATRPRSDSAYRLAPLSNFQRTVDSPSTVRSASTPRCPPSSSALAHEAPPAYSHADDDTPPSMRPRLTCPAPLKPLGIHTIRHPLAHGVRGLRYNPDQRPVGAASLTRPKEPNDHPPGPGHSHCRNPFPGHEQP